MAFIVSIGTTPVRGTYAYFTNTQQNTGNTFTTASLQPPTDLTARQTGGQIQLTWNASTSTFANGYDVYRRVNGDASYPGTPIGSTANGATAFVDVPPTTTSGVYDYKVVSKAGTTGGWVSATFAEVLSVSFTASQARVVPPTFPANNATGLATNTDVIVVFSEAMNQTTTGNAFTLVECIDNTSNCTIPGLALPGGTTWYGGGGPDGAGGDGKNILRFNPTADLTVSTWHRVTITAATATDVAGATLSGGDYVFVFQTAASPDASAPTGVTLDLSSAVGTSETTWMLTGTTSEANALIHVYRDDTPESGDNQDGLVATLQLTGDLSNFSIPVPLVSGPNRFSLKATDTANQQQTTGTFTPVIRSGDTRTTPATAYVIPGSNDTEIVVKAPFIGDANGNNTASVRWRQNAGVYNTATAMSSRTSSEWSYTITGLTGGTVYDIETTLADADGIVSGSPSATQTVSTTAAYKITSISTSPSGSFASRANQQLAITVNTTGATGLVITINTTSPVNTGCLDVTDNNETWSWNGLDGGAAFVADGTYTFSVKAYSDAGCTSLIHQLDRTAVVSNVVSISLEPAPGTTTVASASDTVCVIARAINSRGEPVANGAAITFSQTSTAGSYSVTPAATTIGSAAVGCTTPASGSGRAVTKLSVITPALSTITVEAAMTKGDGSTLRNKTTINDPPDAPTDLVLTPGSIRVSFRPSSTSVAVGYYVHLGVAPATYDRKIDIGQRTTYSVEDVVPGQRYWVAVQAYDKLGQTSPLSNEASLLAPPTLHPVSITLDATSRTPGAPLRLGAIVRARVLDASGRAVGGAPITLSSGVGTRLESTSMITDVSGEAATGLTVDDQTLAQTRITASSGSAAGSLDLTLMPQTATPTATAGLTATVTGTVVLGTPTPLATPATSTLELTPSAPAGNAAVSSSPTIGTTQAVGSPATATGIPAVTGTPGAVTTATPTPPPVPSSTLTPVSSGSPAAPTASAPPAGAAVVTPTPEPPAATSSPTGGQVTAAAPTATGAATSAGGSAATAPAGSSSSPAATAAPPTSPPSTSVPATSAPATSPPPTSAPQSSSPPTSAPSTSGTSNAPAPTSAPSTSSSSSAQPASTVGATQ